MKNMYIASVLFLVFSIKIASAQVSFETSVLDITKSGLSDTQFTISIDTINQKENIAYWKVRSYCDSKMTIQLTASSTNDCGKAVRFDSLTDNAFSFLFNNKDSKLKNFSLKLKAYDKNGKWLYTEKESFRWK
jgi:hypothetical protein